MVEIGEISLRTESSALYLKEVVSMVCENLRTIGCLVRELSSSADQKPHKVLALKTNLKVLRDLVSGCKVSTSAGNEVHVLEVLFGTPTAFLQAIDSEDRSLSWVLRVKNLVMVASRNVAIFLAKIDKEIASLRKAAEHRPEATPRMALRKRFEECVVCA